MSFDESLEWSRGDAPKDVPRLPSGVNAEVPYQLDVLPDGSETVVIGDVKNFSEFCHQQGENPFGFEGTCGLCSCELIMRQFGLQITEADVVAYARQHRLCNTRGLPPRRGGTTHIQQERILSDFGVPAHYETTRTLDDLAASIQHGQGVILHVDAGVLWNSPKDYDGYANHAVTAIGVARDLETGQIQGFYINDTGPGTPGRLVDVATMDEAWVKMGGACVVTDQAYPKDQQRTTS